jgi:hypothetical protein
MKQCSGVDSFKAVVFVKISADPNANPNLITKTLRSGTMLAQV